MKSRKRRSRKRRSSKRRSRKRRSSKNSKKIRKFGTLATETTEYAQEEFQKRLRKNSYTAGAFLTLINLKYDTNILSFDYNHKLKVALLDNIYKYKDTRGSAYLIEFAPIIHAAVLNFLLYPDTLHYVLSLNLYKNEINSINQIVLHILKVSGYGNSILATKISGPLINYALTSGMTSKKFEALYIKTCSLRNICSDIQGIKSITNLIQKVINKFEGGAYEFSAPLIHTALLNHYIHPETEQYLIETHYSPF